MKVLNWVSDYPDLNLVEHPWDVLDQQVLDKINLIHVHTVRKHDRVKKSLPLPHKAA